MPEQQSATVGRAFREICASLFALAVIAGCGGDTSAPTSLESAERDAVKRNLAALGGRVTSDTEDGLYFTVRNTYVDIRDAGGTVEGTYKTRQDVDDFGKVSAAIAKVFVAGADNSQFEKWLRTSMSGGSRAPQQADFNRLKVTLSRVPLHLMFSLNQQSEMQ